MEISQAVLRKHRFKSVVLFTIDDTGKVDHSAAFDGPEQQDLTIAIYKALHSSLLSYFGDPTKGVTIH